MSSSPTRDGARSSAEPVRGDNTPLPKREDDVKPASSADSGNGPAKGGGRYDDEDQDQEEEDDDDEDEDEDEDEEDEEEEDDDEDERRDSGRRKRRRQGVNRFVDVEAVVDDDEEEYDDEDTELLKEDGFIEQDLGGDDEDFQRRTAADNQMLDRQRRREEELNAEQIAAELRERYRNQRGITAQSDYAEIPQRMLMPSVNDPGLYAVRCRPGRERAVIQTILRKAIRAANFDSMNIISAFCRDSIPGRIYVEARESKHVVEACSDVAGAFAREETLFLVPINEMADLLKITKNQQELKIGGWVRFKTGKYAGDLAQVLDFTENGETVGVKFVPRLDLDPRESDVFIDSAGRKRKKGGKNTIADRPPPRFFNAEEVAKLFRNEVHPKGAGNYVFRNQTFSKGYCEDDVPARRLLTENVNPTLDEVSRFTGESITSGAAHGLGAGQQGVDLNLLADATKSKADVVLRKDDHVEVFEGEQSGVEGIIDTVGNEVVTIKLVYSDLEDQTIEVPTQSVRKKFRAGDHIKVIAGKHRDETGLVVKVEDNITTFLSDLSMNEVSVFSKDIHEAAEVGSGANAHGGYELHNLVQLDAQTAGVIFKIEREVFMILDQLGNVRTVRPHQIAMKRDSARAVGVDSEGGEFRTGDSMKETEGDEREGVVLHVYQSTLVWLFNRDMRENAGVFLVRARQLRPRAPRGVIKSNLSKQNPALQAAYGQAQAQQNATIGGASSNMRRPGGRDEHAGKTVQIIRGPYKTYRGIIKDTNGPMARVELHTMPKILTVSIDWLKQKDPITGESRPLNDRARFSGDRSGTMGPPAAGAYGATARNPYINGGAGAGGAASRGGSTPAGVGMGRTPAHNPYISGGRTPAYNPNGGKTPAYNPYADGGKTPAYNPYADGGKTPAYNPYASGDGGKTPAYGAGGKTPAYNPYVDGGKTPAYTPYGADGGKTPAYTPYGGAEDGKTPAYGNGDGVGRAGPPPSRYDGGGYSAPTPMGAPTPGDWSAPTPGAYAAPTPGAGAYTGAPTPGDAYAAPTPGGLGAPTPGGAGHGGYGAPTPAAYGQTPYSSGPPQRGTGDGSSNDTVPLLERILVRVVRSPRSGKSLAAGRHDGATGYVHSLSADSSLATIVLDDAQSTRLDGVAREFVSPLRPSTIRAVCLALVGEYRGKRVIVQSLDGEQILGQCEGKSVFFDVANLARAS